MQGDVTQKVFLDEKKEKAFDEKLARIDELADLHARVSTLETNGTRLSRRLTALEENSRGHYNGDDPMAGMSSLVWVAVALTLLPIVADMIQKWHSSQSS